MDLITVLELFHNLFIFYFIKIKKKKKAVNVHVKDAVLAVGSTAVTKAEAHVGMFSHVQ